MDIGFLTACFQIGLEEVLDWAVESKIYHVEIGGMHAGYMHADYAEDIIPLFSERGITVTALGVHPNNLDADEKKRKQAQASVKKLIDAAAALNIEVVSTFVGYNNLLDYQGNLKLFKKEFVPLCEYALEKDVKIAIENCPAKGEFHFTSGNLMSSPAVWGVLFGMAPENFGLNFDPSHLHWQRVNPALIVEEFPERIFHTHAKDTITNHQNLEFAGIYGANTYWYALPGDGEINWGEYMDALKEVGYNGVLSIEHEDPAYLKDEEKKKEGILKAKAFLETHLN